MAGNTQEQGAGEQVEPLPVAVERSRPFRRQGEGQRPALPKQQVVLQEVMGVKQPKGQKAAVSALAPLMAWEHPPGLWSVYR